MRLVFPQSELQFTEERFVVYIYSDPTAGYPTVWCYPTAGYPTAGYPTVYCCRVREEVVLADLLKSYLHASASLRKECVEQQVAVFLKTEKVPPSSASYQRLQLQASLGDSLRDRAIIEFPELHIVPLSAAGQYENHLPPSLPLQQTSLARLAAEYCSSSEEGERVL